MSSELIEKELSFEIRNADFTVHSTLGPGFLESNYEEAMLIELERKGFPFERQKKIEIIYQGRVIGIHVLDIVVKNKVILELKAVSDLLPIHKQQALSYLKATGLPLALVINFGENRVHITRVVHTLQLEGS